MQRALQRSPEERVNWAHSIPFFLAHLLPGLAVFTGVPTKAVVLAVVLYGTRMFFITAGYHRYFSHRSYKLGRPMQLVMAIGGASAAQKGPLWWASHHRDHHRYSDTELDVHSPLKGFWWSHVGWILSDKYKSVDYDSIRDFARFPELRFIDRHDWIAPWTLGVITFLIAGWPGLLIGFFASTVALWHGTFIVNSLAHVMGRRRYATPDTSRNSLLIALVTGGEGWHNNHHYYQASARQGFFWWEIDVSYYVLKILSLVGLVGDLKTPPAKLRASGRLDDGHFDIGMFRAYRAKTLQVLGSARAKAAAVLARSHTSREDAIDASRQALEAKLRTEQETLDALVRSTLEAADELAKISRQRNREKVLAE